MMGDRDIKEMMAPSKLNHPGSDTELEPSTAISAGECFNSYISGSGLVHPAVVELLARKRDMDRDTSREEEQFDGHQDLDDIMISDGMAWGTPYPDADAEDALVAGQSSQICNSESAPVRGHGVTMYPGCDTIYPATTESRIQADLARTSNGPVHVPEKQGMMYLGCNVVYPAPSTAPPTPEVSPAYSTYNPNNLPTITTAVQHFPSPSVEERSNSPTSTTQTISNSLENEKQADFTINNPSINSTSTSDLIHPSPGTKRYLFYLRLLIYYRLTIRLITIFISLSVFILTLLAITAFLSISSTSSTHSVSLSPHKAFASISGIFTLLSLGLNIACCASKRVRRITPLSNLLFALISIAGIFGWLSGCLYLQRHRHSSRQNLWYYACSAADTYYDASGGSGAAKRSLDLRDYGSSDAKLSKICNFTQNAWDLGILQICFEILTFINAVIAIIMVRMGLVPKHGRGRKCFV